MGGLLMMDVSTLLSRLASKKVAGRDPAEARGSRRNPRRNPVRFPRSESKQPSPKLNAASSFVVVVLLRRLADARTPQPRGRPSSPPPPPGMERPEELQPPEEGSGEKPPVMSPNVAVWKNEKHLEVQIDQSLTHTPLRAEQLQNNNKKLFQMCVSSVLWLFFPLFPRFPSPHSAAPTLPRVSMVPRQTC